MQLSDQGSNNVMTDIETIEIDLDEKTISLLEGHFERTILSGFSEQSMSIWKQKELSLAERLGETILNEYFISAVEAALENIDE